MKKSSPKTCEISTWRERDRERGRQAGRGQITHKCGSGRVGMREKEREREAGRQGPNE